MYIYIYICNIHKKYCIIYRDDESGPTFLCPADHRSHAVGGKSSALSRLVSTTPAAKCVAVFLTKCIMYVKYLIIECTDYFLFLFMIDDIKI
jgi:hypothetical protein